MKRHTLLGQRLTPAWRLTLLFGMVCGGIVAAANLPMTRPCFLALKAVPFADKLAHFCLVGILAFLLNSALGAVTVRVAGQLMLKGNLFLVALATVEELSNLIQPFRGFSLGDLFFNYLGIFTFGWLSLFVVRKSDVDVPAAWPEWFT